MNRLHILLISLLLTFNCAFARTVANIAAIDINQPIDYLNGKVSTGSMVKGKMKFQKLKTVSKETFDYVFDVSYDKDNDNAILLLPLSSGKYENKPMPCDAIKIEFNNDAEASKFMKSVIRIADKGFMNFMIRYSGYIEQVDEKNVPKGYEIKEDCERAGCNLEKGMYYKYYFNEYTRKNPNGPALKTKENMKDMEKRNRKSGYEVLYDRTNDCFGVADVVDGKLYWGSDAKAYLAQNYLSSMGAKMSVRAAESESDKMEIEKCISSFAAGSNRHIKFTYRFGQDPFVYIVIFSGFNKDDNMVDELALVEKNHPDRPIRLVKSLWTRSFKGSEIEYEIFCPQPGDNGNACWRSATFDDLKYIDTFLNESDNLVNNTGVTWKYMVDGEPVK